MFTKRIALVLSVIFSLIMGYSQPTTVATQNFDGGGAQTTFTATGSWVNDATYYSSGLNSIHADVPALLGGETYYTSDVIDISPVAYPPNGFEFVKLRFKQICKVSPLDTVKVQYKLDVPGAAWIDLPSSAYEGTVANYGTNGFNAGSYSVWAVGDSLAYPDNGWWREEVFDLSDDVGYERFQIRFYLKRGNTLATNISYGWNIDDFSVKANSIAMITPTLEWSGTKRPHDTLYSTGPYLIEAVIASNTSAPLHPIYLKWTHTYNNVSATDSVLMTNTTGNIYVGTIPQYVVGTQVTYSITAMDTGYNEKTISESYVIVVPPCGDVSVGISEDIWLPYTGNASYTISGVTVYPHLGPAVGTSGGYGNYANGYVVLYPQYSTAQLEISGSYSTESCCDYLRIYDGAGTGGTLLGEYRGSGSVPLLTSTNGALTVFFYSDVSVNTASNATYFGFVLDVICTVGGRVCLDNSATLFSIDMPDTTTACLVPIVATVKNAGDLNLSSVTAYYSINGGTPVSTVLNYNPSLPWDFTSQDTIGYYIPSANTWNTVTVWIELPNNAVDSVTIDDTLTKYVYHTSDISLQLVVPPTDTVYSTGPYSITAQVNSRSGSPIINPVYLYLEITDSLSNISYDTIVMVSQGGNIWWGEIPNLPYESDVVYTVSVNDNCNTALESGGHYYIKYMGCTGGDASVGIPINFSYTGSAQSRMFPIGTYKLEVWGAQGGNPAGTTDAKGGYSVGEITLSNATRLYVYVGGQGQLGSTGGGYNGGGNPTTTTYYGGGGASDVRITDTSLYARVIVAGGGGGYRSSGMVSGAGGGLSGEDGTYSGGGAGTAGTQTAGGASNPSYLTYVTNGSFGLGGSWIPTAGSLNGFSGGGGGWYGGGAGHGSGGGSGYVYTSSTATNYPLGCLLNSSYYLANAQTIVGNTTMPAVAGGTETGHSGDGYVRITPLMLITSCLDNSVSMDAFVSPTLSVNSNSLIPVTVRIRNKGVLPLYSCDINWTLGGVSQPSVSYNNITGLPYDFTDTITLGYFNTSGTIGSGYDVVAWVDLPNGQYDSTAVDDTLAISSTVCGTLSSLTIGTSPAADFATISAARAALSICGMHGLVTLNFEDGTYTGQVDLSSFSSIMTSTDTLVIQSLNGIASGVIFNAGSSSALRMNGNSNIYIKNITLTSTSAHGVEFTGYCNNIEINSCIINANPTATSTTSCGIYYNNVASSAMGSLRVLNNTINGGYAGIYLSYWHKTSNERNATTKYVTIVNNTIENWYYYGIYSNYYISYDTIGYNTIVSRTNSSTQYGIYLYYYNWAKYVIGNKINFRGTSTAYGIYPYYYFNDGTAVAGLIANNEIRKLSTATSFYGGYHYYAKAMWINNTVYAQNNGGTHYGIYIAYAASTYPLTFKNNIVSITGSGTNYAIYASTATYAQSPASLFDYNDYNISGANIAYIVSPISNTLSDMRLATGQDAHSIIVTPPYNNVSNDLSLQHDAATICPRDANVLKDISGLSRSQTTSMGCYQPPTFAINAALVEFVSLKEGSYSGQADTLRVRVVNTGTAPLTSLNITWTHNGVATTSTYPVSLSFGAETILNLGTFVYAANGNEFEAWLNSVNGAPDSYIMDDTVRKSVWICTAPYSGYLLVGAGGTFKDPVEAVYAIYVCGVSGDVTLALTPNDYNCQLSFKDISTVLGANKLTITSTTGNPTSVRIDGPIIFSNTSNVELNSITVGGYDKIQYDIHFQGGGSNITIQNCYLLTDTNTSSSLAAPIYKTSGTGVVDNIIIKNNLIEGGYYGICFYGGTGTTVYGTHAVIDSNTIKNQYYYGTYPYYVSFDSYAYNTIISRKVNYTTWYGLGMRYCNGDIIGNRIYKRFPTGTVYGMYTTCHNYYLTTDTAIVANNEIIIDSASTTYAFYITSYSISKIVHNSIYAGGTGASVRGFYVVAAFNGVLKNNLVYTKPSSSYPIYVAGAYLTYCQIGYNDYYAPTYVGYLTSARTTIAAWVTAVPQDTTSVRVLPTFSNTAQSLEIGTYNSSLQVPSFNGVTTDIKNLPRVNPTTMGAYIQPMQGYDLMMLEITPWIDKCVENQTINIYADILNTALQPVTTATFGWSINGIVQPSVTYTFTPALGALKVENVLLTAFVVTGNINTTYDIVLWVESINSLPDTVNWNDTVSARTTVIPLAEFVALSDTISSLSFNVDVNVYPYTGAPVATPVMYIHTSSSCIDERDTIPMIKDGNIWTANIPKQYYNTKVVYEVTIADTIGNIITLIDSTYIMVDEINVDSNFGTYTGDEQTVRLSAGTYKLEVWGAQGGDGTSTNYTAVSTEGGRGGYSVGEITLASATTLYIHVGGAGTSLPPGGNTASNTILPGGYNGGGYRSLGTAAEYGSSGGGATHIATAPGLLSALSTNQSAVLIVAGGGGGHGEDDEQGGYGGGSSGGQGAGQSYTATAGTQAGPGTNGTNPAANGSFGQGGNTIGDGGGGGGGWYGGASPSGSETLNADGGGGSGGSGYVSPLLTNAQTIAGNTAFPAVAGGTEIGHSGDGYVRITKLPAGKVIGGSTMELYSGTNLAMTKLLSPTNENETMCALDSLPVQVRLSNLGETDYDFTVDSVIVRYEINSPKGVSYSGAVTLNTEELLSGESMDIELMPALYLPQGIHQIKAWVVSPIDNFVCDDTLIADYISERLNFPYDENFSAGITTDLTIFAVNTSNQWQPTTQGIGIDSMIVPTYGDSMLVFAGSKGSITRIVTRQLDIAGAYQPKLTLWYYQDTGNAKDYTNVYITTDGGTTFTHLFSLQRGNSSIVLPEWIDYTIDLSPYQNGSCIYLMLESMVKSNTGGAQYIDRIRLDAKQDMAVGAILMDSISACDLSNKSIKVVLSNMTSQGINFVNYPTALHVNITGVINQSLTIPFTSGTFVGMSDDTLDIWTGNITSGTYQITAFIESVDDMLSNDTMALNITIDPKLHVSAVNNTTLGTYCVLPNTQLEQDIVVYNTGNLDLEDIVVKMEISNTSGAITETVLDTIAGILSGGNSVSHKMSNTYAVPVASYYNVKVTAYPLCNSAITSDTTLVECADLDDIELVSIEQPLSSAIDTFGRSQNIVVKVRNNNPDNDAANVKLHAEVIANGGVVFTAAGTINSIVAGSDVNYSFTTSYTIPREVSYTLKVYVESQDKIASNDTLLVNRTAADTLPIVDDILPIGKDGISLSQNIPNPASNTTKVEYSLPHDGKAVFNIYTTAGQVIYTQSVDAIVGKNNIIFDLNGLSSGIYFYSMEFEGQKLVRKMSVK